MSEFAGKVVIVTGGAQGIGLATSRAFAESGAKVFAWDADEQALAELERIEAVRCDVGEPLDIEAASAQVLAAAGAVDVLVNNAGIGWPHGLFDLTVEEWDRVLNVNLRSVFLTARAFAGSMPAGSAIVNIASTRALMSEPGTEPYSASKGGVVALTHSMAITLAPRRIRVNCVSPGWIETSEYQKASRRRKPELSGIAHAQHPVGRVGVPEDIATAVMYLASARAGFVTGTNLVVDGGMTVKMIYEE